ncbi:putative nucleic-acid-binding protein [Marinobacter sp. LV10R520-4]|uniref:PIN domain-containing protein n=1 Tax=Marinobacter sp. LV10R520-4 TaxID=1761796 RepID=UPI000BF95ED9|nr:type II toxin-antitoxin system VapC family toxin [Marinobacter sp. LV10R520-4]PFG53574.1 putative nucleic-acid-binding protein [Marinobacter sp. LV10R520-4]
MIGLDTNVLVRYLTQDDAAQSALANQVIEEQLTPRNPGFISSIVLVEVVWVLETCYNQTQSAIEAIVNGLLMTRQLVVDEADLVYLALKRFSGGNADFSDALIAVISENRGCSSTLTFDKKAQSVGMVYINETGAFR